ncbi:MAG: SiaB family protein kinase [Desulfatirhabdiaceae bacterium]
MQNLLQLKEDFSRQGILISFNGPFTHSIIEEIGNATRRYLEGRQHGKGIITDVFAVYIEQTQNVRNYLQRHHLSAEIQGSAIVVIRDVASGYTVCSGNSIRKEDVPDLISRLERINSLNRDGLKKFYKEQLRKKREPDAIGAGVGLIDMARRASGKIEYTLENQDAGYDFFSLFVTVSGA